MCDYIPPISDYLSKTAKFDSRITMAGTSSKQHDLTSIIVQIPKSASFMFVWAPSSKIFEPKITNIFN